MRVPWLLLLLGSVAVPAQAEPWSATFYYGPSTSKYILAVLSSGSYQPTGTTAGFALDRKIVPLGWDISLSFEAQVTETFSGSYRNTTFALGPGIAAHEPFGWKGTELSFYTGPSYATDPLGTGIGYGGKIETVPRKKWLNFVGVEFAARIAPDSDWDVVGRLYHRSGAFGLYAENLDAGMAVGIGIRRRF
jgi:hypothetical protein